MDDDEDALQVDPPCCRCDGSLRLTRSGIRALPLDTQLALQSFLLERETQQKRFDELAEQAERDDALEPAPLSIEDFAEDWNASQFWYDDETATTLAERLLDGIGDTSCIACISAPSVFIQLKKILATRPPTAVKPTLTLFEYDLRFAVFKKEFVHYDFRHPTRLPAILKGSFDRIICDPPFLSQDCQTKAAKTARWLSSSSWSISRVTKDVPSKIANEISPAASAASTPTRLIVSTGERMGPLVCKSYAGAGVLPTTFEPRHAKGLGNEFGCYANFECASWDWR